jgi:transcriptional regulator with XRE-family HTH domain
MQHKPIGAGKAPTVKASGGQVDKDATKRFGRNVSEARRRAGISQQELGRRCSLHRTHISYIENGERKPRVDNFVRLAAGLEVRPEELLRGVAWTLPPPPPNGSSAVRRSA